ncbi:GlsB/YeaQ/YmgE family stress response membrane protein [Oceanibium sediminis]|uniref:GlsB/YeaQ/YmgE family stress response membrane protein n=1 Tax=Oceanibium sediminis TaxID=2026339 RepID=UPI000DD40AB5|nr:GlsB/YeaQ/YmgE family stress response membrane protein [Oceanibium sediminis]
MGIVYLIIIGAAAGFLATRIMNVNMGVAQTIALGVVGALVGGVLLRLLIAGLGAAAGFVGALVGTLALLWAYKVFIERR